MTLPRADTSGPFLIVSRQDVSVFTPQTLTDTQTLGPIKLLGSLANSHCWCRWGSRGCTPVPVRPPAPVYVPWAPRAGKGGCCPAEPGGCRLCHLRFLPPSCMAKGTLTWHGEGPRLVVWVPVRDGLGQVLNGHLVLLAGFYHEVAEVKMPLRRREKGQVDPTGSTAQLSASCGPRTPLYLPPTTRSVRNKEKPPPQTPNHGLLHLCVLWPLPPGSVCLYQASAAVSQARAREGSHTPPPISPLA